MTRSQRRRARREDLGPPPKYLRPWMVVSARYPSNILYQPWRVWQVTGSWREVWRQMPILLFNYSFMEFRECLHIVKIHVSGGKLTRQATRPLLVNTILYEHYNFFCALIELGKNLVCKKNAERLRVWSKMFRESARRLFCSVLLRDERASAARYHHLASGQE